MSAGSRMWLIGGTWFAVLVSVMVESIAVKATLTATALLFAICVAPAAVALVMGFAAPSPVMGVWLHSDNRTTRVR